jgi:hypothetical protein
MIKRNKYNINMADRKTFVEGQKIIKKYSVTLFDVKHRDGFKVERVQIAWRPAIGGGGVRQTKEVSFLKSTVLSRCGAMTYGRAAPRPGPKCLIVNDLGVKLLN